PDGTKVTVSGYTDSVGSDSANKKLSKKRAQAVADVISDSRSDLELSVKGYGEADPVAKNTAKGGEDNPQGRAKNRRVEVSYADDCIRCGRAGCVLGASPACGEGLQPIACLIDRLGGDGEGQSQEVLAGRAEG